MKSIIYFTVMKTLLRMLSFSFLAVLLVIVSACDKPYNGTTNQEQKITATDQSNANTLSSTNEQQSITDKTMQPARLATEFKTIEWTDLMLKEDLDALLNPPSYVTEVEDGSFEDQINNQLQSPLATANDDSYQRALTSRRIIPEMDGQAIRIPGFIVPLAFDGEQTITQFFLVPFFGACLHMPPPPPNQMIFINYPQGIKLEALYDAFWVSGILQTSLVENEVATAAYSMQMQSFEIYE